MNKNNDSQKIVIYWARRDLRLADNPALTAASLECNNDNTLFLPIYILEDYMLSAKPLYQFGYPSRFFLANAIPEFASRFEEFLLLRGKGAESIINLVKILQATYTKAEIVVHVNDDVYVDFYKQIAKLNKSDVKVMVHNDQLTVNREIKSGANNLYSIFTPFKKAVWKEFLTAKVLSKVNTKDLNYLNVANINNMLEGRIIKDITFDNIWSLFSKNRIIHAGKNVINIDELININSEEYHDNLKYIISEDEAIKHLDNYIKSGKIRDYNICRDSLSLDAESKYGATSKMSLPLAWGFISSRYIKSEIQDYYDDDFLNVNFMDKETFGGHDASAVQYISELIWREFYKYLLYNNPALMSVEFQEKFRNSIKWETNDIALSRFISWIKGETGYAVVDSAMHQLAKTGLMHNRSRMIVASILSKNLGVDWRWGQEYFRAMLLDLDEASNNGGWQWGASVGADPKPIRIFNPYLQAENYDKSKVYINKWLPENYNITPIIEHKDARLSALRRYGLDTSDAARDY